LQNLSRGAAQAGVAIDISRRIETALEAAGATGKGLHEKASSIEGRLPPGLVRKLRFIASVRNKIVHEDEVLPEEDFSAFAESGRLAMEELERAMAGGKGGKPRPKSKPRGKAAPRPAPPAAEAMVVQAGRTARRGGMAFLGGAALVFLLMVLGGDGPELWAGAFAIYFLLGWHYLRRTRRAAGPG
jgi:hypothetical protein